MKGLDINDNLHFYGFRIIYQNSLRPRDISRIELHGLYLWNVRI